MQTETETNQDQESVRGQYHLRLFKHERALIAEAAGDYRPAQWIRATVLERAREVVAARKRANSTD